MIIESPEALRDWLTLSLEPICDADPAALAKYVLALLKKDRPEVELREFCVDQLDVFLQKETKGFVELLFSVIRDRSYHNKATISSVSVDSDVPVAPVQQVQSTGTKKQSPREIHKAISDVRTAPKSPVTAKSSGRDENARSRSRDKDVRRRKSQSPRSRSREKFVRTRQSAVTEIPAAGGGRIRDLRDRLGIRNADRDRSRSRSRDHKLRSGKSIRKEKTPTLSPDADGKEKAKCDVAPGSITDSALSPCPIGADSDAVQGDGKKTDGKDKRKPRCRDFDEKGYCMLGDLCPYDHGPDPVVVEDVALPGMISVSAAAGAHSLLRAPPPNFAIPPPGYRSQVAATEGGASLSEQYNPETPGIAPLSMLPPPPNFSHPPPPLWHASPIVPSFAAPGMGIGHGALINLAGGEQGRKRGMYDDGPPFKRRVQERLGPREEYQKAKAVENCELEVRKVPPYLNNINRLNKHFSQFGTVTSIKVQFDGDPEAALVSFSSHAEAMQAYRSTVPILNNRFIRIFWHNDPFQKTPVKERLGERGTGVGDDDGNRLNEPNVDADKSNKAVLYTSKGGLSKTLYNPEALKAAAAVKSNEATPALASVQELNDQALAAERAKQEKLAQRNEKMKEALKQKMDLQKRKADLFQKQLGQQKLLLKQLEKCRDAAQKKEIVSTIKALEKSISGLKEDLQSLRAQVPKTKEQLEKEILDTELEAVSVEQSGGDSTNLRRKLRRLRLELGAIGVRQPPPRLVDKSPLSTSTPIHHTGGRGRGRLPYYTNTYGLDKRPRELRITGFRLIDQELLLDHFKQFGEVERFTVDEKDVTATLVYKQRREAEAALTGGAQFPNGALTVQWASQASKPQMQTAPLERKASEELTAEALLASLGDDGDSEDELSNEDDILLGEEEEDDDG